ncbi:MAG: penicillin-insensitive murein endopeptidase [Rhizobiales bacterium]|nr:penicillin-insensitive murein endopeptidase [Hyphomicrobiales bacterium]
MTTRRTIRGRHIACLASLAALLALGSALAAPDRAAAEDLPPAKELFGMVVAAAPMEARAIGFYSRGCLAGGVALPVDGPAWQAMRLSRNRNWGHPALIDYVKQLADDSQRLDGWPGLLVGDMQQPRGGPMLTGHSSHQVGLDADIWLTPMPDRRLTWQERENLAATSMLKNTLEVNPAVFTERHVALIRRAASYPEVNRVGVNPAIKHALCKANGGDAPWLAKVQMWPGHHYHMHIRLDCPRGSEGCKSQDAPGGTSCAAAEEWYRKTKAAIENPPRGPRPKPKPAAPKPELTLAQLPAACREVLAHDRPPLILKGSAAVASVTALPVRRPR